VVGDVAGITENGKPLPMMIPPAQQEGRLVASNLRRLIEGRPLVSFRYRDPGMMATIGRNSGVAQLGASGRLRFSGFIGWAAWLGFHLLKVISFRNRLVVLVNWATEYFFYDRPVRLITKPEEPRLEQEPAVQR
jgi:NADH dehydrogenase